ncbi:hypothetical protein [Stenotrophomonas phage BUCT598]|uniref:Uncharacterized protein n=1 Tax=Stenotrophomonas phage BUCT598 TaxID=2834253 RepID=A0A8F2F469_9CAUD|nr:hypothetical protein [Stenotrophomonas phage BUCT598]
MSLMNAAMKAKLAAAKKVGPNMNEATAGGGYTVTPEGKNARLRLVGYYEVGKHVVQKGPYAGKKVDEVKLVWELSGNKWEPQEFDGKKVPYRITDTMTYSLSEKANFFKLFKRMNECHGGEATIMAELLGKEFLGDVVHNKSKTDDKKVFANLVNIRKAERENDDGDIVPVKVAEPLTELKMFIWDIADKEMWDSIFIDGQYEEKKDKDGNVTHKAKSKNVIQEYIMSALNWDECPVAELVKSGATAQEAKELDDAIGGADNEDDEPPFPTEQEDAGEPDLNSI